MTILPVHYSDNPRVNAAVQQAVANMVPNPYDWRGTNDDKTVAAILENVRRAFGDYALSVKIAIH